MAQDGEVAPSFQPLLGWSRSIFWGAYGGQVADPAIEADRRIAQIQDQIGARQKLMQALLQAALKHGGCLTVTQGVMETSATFAEVEQALQAMMGSGYVYMRDNVDTGVIEYVFTEMQSNSALSWRIDLKWAIEVIPFLFFSGVACPRCRC